MGTIEIPEGAYTIPTIVVQANCSIRLTIKRSVLGEVALTGANGGAVFDVQGNYITNHDWWSIMQDVQNSMLMFKQDTLTISGHTHGPL